MKNNSKIYDLLNFKIKINKIHFIGIGGSGMSGIAEILFNLGFEVSGSDIQQSSITDHLKLMGMKISIGHHPDNINQQQAVVVSSAIDDSNSELIQALKLGIPIVPRAEMLSELMRFRYGIAIAGTHGKTTTTSLISHIMSLAGLDPTYVIGGILKSSGSNANLGESDFLIAEADESDGSFLMLNPMISVITNIDKDHLENYNNSFLRLKKAYAQFANNLPFYGTCIVCGEDKNLSSIQRNIHRKIISYGFDSKNNLYAKDIEFSNSSMTFKVVSDHHETPFDVSLNLVGKHNVLNALAAVSIAFELGIDSEIVQTALNSFEGIARRLDSHGVVNINNSKVEVFDDYGHHPNEINAVLSALKETRKDKRLFVIFQPHRYTRTQILFNDFVKTLSKADQLILIDIYPASESPIENVSSEILANAIRQTSKLNPVVAKDIDEAFLLAENSIQDDDILLTLGAGNIYQLAKKLSQ